MAFDLKRQLYLSCCLILFYTNLIAGFSLQKLQTNYLTTPLGLDEAKPQFSWQMQANDAAKDYKQVAYQIQLTDENQQSIWNTQKIASDLSHGIQYNGPDLQPTTRYTWKLTVWDNHNQEVSTTSWFETGLMNPSIEAWSGAKWIGGADEDLVFYSQYLSVFKLQFGIQLDQKTNSTKASFVFGANDSRLKNQYLNLMAVQTAKNQSYVAIELDISSLDSGQNGTAKLNIYRVGYAKSDRDDVPMKSLDIPLSLVNQTNKYDGHVILVDCNFGLFNFYIDVMDAAHKVVDPDVPVARFGASGTNLNPVGSGNNFISFPMVCDIGMKTGQNQTAFFYDVKVRHLREPSNVLFNENLNETPYNGIFKSANLSIENGKFKVLPNTFLTADPSRNATPMLRMRFSSNAKKIKKARLYATARGIYELYLNGKRVSEEFFNPGLTQYNKSHSYQTFDITNSLKSGSSNVIGAMLGEGWWSGNITYGGENWNYFGDRQSLLTKMVITYEDNSQQTIVSDDKNWKLFTDGPIRCGSFFQGEVYDAGKEAKITNWSLATYSDKAWKKAVEVPLSGTTFNDKKVLNFDQCQLIGELGDKITQIKTLTAQKVMEVRPKVFVYDMGQNMVGIPQIKIKNGKKGQVINLRFAEVTYPDMAEYKGNEGMIMLENIRAALAQDIYILKGGNEIIQPRFTFHGYRYLEITGIDKAIPLTDVKGVVISSVKTLASKYETSNPTLNRFWENITWSLYGNFISIPTDCPQRNERMGWSGDIMVFARSATYLTDANPFLKKHLLAMRDVQPANGRFTDVAPVGGGFGGTLWGSAGIVVGWESYRQYGDITLLSDHYEAMKKYIAFLETKVMPENQILNEGPLGDWLSPEGNKNDNTLFWMSYFAYDLEIMSKVASELGKSEDAKSFAKRSEEVKAVFNQVYVDKNKHKTVKSGLVTGFMGAPNEADGRGASDKGQLMNTQASYAVPLALDMFDAENKPFAVNNLEATILKPGTDDGGVVRPELSLMTGFIGTASISEALSENGKEELAYKLLLNEKYPSWLYSVVNGATTIWERLNSYTKEDGFGGNNSMNSFNHYSFGAVAAWMYNYSLGIQRHPEINGFKEFVLKPTPDPTKQLKFAKGYYDSLYGRIESAWEWKEGNKWIYKCTVPANTTATLYLPANKVIKESGIAIELEKGDGQNGSISLDSGSYIFEIGQ